MFRIFARERDQHLVDNGRVYCPKRGCDVEFDTCAGCRWLVRIDEQGQLPYVECRPDQPLPLTGMWV